VAAAHESAFKRELVGTVGTGYNVAITTTVNGYRLGGLDSGERVIIIGRDVNNEWYWVRTRLGIGYIRAAALQALVDFSQVPVVQVDLSAPPLPPATPVDDLALYPVFLRSPHLCRKFTRRGLAAGIYQTYFPKLATA